MEINPRLPTNLLRAGRVFVFEPPPGVRANLLRTFSQVPSQRMAKVRLVTLLLLTASSLSLLLRLVTILLRLVTILLSVEYYCV